MPTVRITGGVLNVAEGSGGEYPDNSLPGSQPGIDNSLPIPPPPPGVWPGPRPSHPIAIAPPGTPPGTIWPSPGVPSHPIATPPPGVPTHPIATPPAPGVPTHPIATPPGGPHPAHPIASQTYWCLVYLPGFGWHYVAVDPSLHVDVSPPAPQPIPTPVG